MLKLLPMTLLLLLGLMGSCYAAEGPSWRPIYENIMKWVNFGILAFILYKYGKGPVKKFIRDQIKAIEEQLSSLESQLKAESLKLEAETKKLEQLESYLEELKARIIELGQREKEAITAEAQKLANTIIQRAEAEANALILKAKAQIKEQLVDRAISLCEAELKKALTINDQLYFFDSFLEEIRKHQLESFQVSR